jgi:hypothetical protein
MVEREGTKGVRVEGKGNGGRRICRIRILRGRWNGIL